MSMTDLYDRTLDTYLDMFQYVIGKTETVTFCIMLQQVLEVPAAFVMSCPED